MKDDAVELLNNFSAAPTRRSILAGLVALGASAATLAPLSRALAQASDEDVKSLTILTQGGPVGDALREFATPLFNQAHPNTAIELEVSSNSVMYPRMVATRNEPAIAGGMFNELFTALGLRDEMWEPLNLENMPNARSVPEALRPDNGHSMIFQQTPYGIMYNPDRVEKPTSWEDLYKPEYKGRVAMWATNLDAYAMAAVAAGRGVDVAAGIEEWIPHKENIGAWVTSPIAEADLVGRGEMWLSPHWGAWAEQARVGGLNVAFTIPKEGGTLWSNHTCCVKGLSPAATALVQAYFDTWYTEEIQREWLVKSFISPTISNIEIPAEFAENEAVLKPGDAEKLYRIPARDLAEEFSRYNTMITRLLRA